MKARLFQLINQARHKLFKAVDAACLEHLGVPGAQLGALFVLQKTDGCQLKDLSRELQLKNSAITGLVSRMEKNGLIERRACEIDGRSSRVHLTPLGRDVAQRAKPLLDVANSELQSGFSKEELAVIVRFLKHAQTIHFTKEKET